MIWDRSEENLRFPTAVRDAEFERILRLESWIIEGVQYEWTGESFNHADLIYILNPNVYVRDYRILRRFIRSRVGIEPWNYKQTFNNLVKMLIQWNHGYNLNGVLNVTQPYAYKRFQMRSTRDVLLHIEEQVRRDDHKACHN